MWRPTRKKAFLSTVQQWHLALDAQEWNVQQCRADAQPRTCVLVVIISCAFGNFVGVESQLGWMQVWLVAGDCFLIGLAPVLVHMSKGPDGKFPFHPVSINLLVEVAKTVFATVVLMIYVSIRFRCLILLYFVLVPKLQ